MALGHAQVVQNEVRAVPGGPLSPIDALPLGCEELCPDNTLKTGKGTRYILSGTEGLTTLNRLPECQLTACQNSTSRSKI